MTRVAVLRPPERADATLAALAAVGIDTVAVPLFHLAPVAWKMPPGRFDALALTSANAVRLGGALPDLPAWTVGPATAQAARAAGLAVAYVGNSGANALFAALRDADIDRVLWLSGTDRAVPVPPGVVAAATYRADPIAVDVAAIVGNVVLVHSPRAAATLAELIPVAARSTTVLVAISRRTAECAGDGWAGITITPRPDDAAVVAAAIDRARGGADKHGR